MYSFFDDFRVKRLYFSRHMCFLLVLTRQTTNGWFSILRFVGIYQKDVFTGNYQKDDFMGNYKKKQLLRVIIKNTLVWVIIRNAILHAIIKKTI